MKSWLRGKPGGVATFLLIAGLVAGGLGWVTAAALRMEREHATERADKDRVNQIAAVMWHLDSYTAPLMAREDARPFDHYGAVHSSPLVYSRETNRWQFGTALELSPLLSASFDEWMLLHFQVNASGWKSPQVLEPDLRKQLDDPRTSELFDNATQPRADLLHELERVLTPKQVLDAAKAAASAEIGNDAMLFLANRTNTGNERNNDVQNFAQNPNYLAPQQPAPNAPPGNQIINPRGGRDFQSRLQQGQRMAQQDERNPEQPLPREVAFNTATGNNKKLLDPRLNLARSTEVIVRRTRMVKVWLTGSDGKERLFALRVVSVGEENMEVCQGVLLDVEGLRETLGKIITESFPDGTLDAVHIGDDPVPERDMTSLPFRLNPGPLTLSNESGWTPLRIGMTLAWVAAIVALLAVGLGGWSLLDLSERRIRFVSAVTHELRTPLTTLRLYIDMLLGGMVRDEKQEREYLETLHGEAERLTQLVGNVLDFSRLEKQRPRLNKTRVEVKALLDRVSNAWQVRCRAAEKELIVDCTLEDGASLETDAELLQQVLGNLIDNACKYSHGAEDRRIWLRARRDGERIVFAVEDRGPGVPRGERRSIFRPFRRGRAADSTSGGVGLGLSLAQRWTKLLGGELALAPVSPEGGARFEVALGA
jgi:signal transduction histidine kinase